MPEAREWRPGKPGEFDELLEAMLREAIHAQRSVTNYMGSAEGWEEFVANSRWDTYQYEKIGYNSGFIAATLNVVENMKAKLPESFVKEASLYIYAE